MSLLMGDRNVQAVTFTLSVVVHSRTDGVFFESMRPLGLTVRVGRPLDDP